MLRKKYKYIKFLVKQHGTVADESLQIIAKGQTKHCKKNIKRLGNPASKSRQQTVKNLLI